MITNRTLVKRYLRRHPTTPRKAVNSAVRTLRRLGADDDLKHVCYVQASEEPSQIMPEGRAGFRRGHCSVVNLEPRDRRDEVGATFTMQHEGSHARMIAKYGPKAVEGSRGLEHEIDAHHETIDFGNGWLKQEKREYIRRRIKEELADEEKAIVELRNGAA